MMNGPAEAGDQGRRRGRRRRRTASTRRYAAGDTRRVIPEPQVLRHDASSGTGIAPTMGRRKSQSSSSLNAAGGDILYQRGLDGDVGRKRIRRTDSHRAGHLRGSRSSIRTTIADQSRRLQQSNRGDIDCNGVGYGGGGSDGDSSSPLPPPPKLQASCLFLPVLLGAFWYWTKRRARRVVTLLHHPHRTCADEEGTVASGGGGAHNHYGGGSISSGNYEVWQDDEIDEYCAWYHGSGWHTDLGSRSHDGPNNGINIIDGSKQQQSSFVLWIKGGPRKKEEARSIADIEIVERRKSTSDTNGNMVPSGGDTSIGAASTHSHVSTSSTNGTWEQIKDVYALDIMGGGSLDWTSTAHDSSYLYDTCGDACGSFVSGTMSSIGGINIPRFTPMMMDGVSTGVGGTEGGGNTINNNNNNNNG